jgi:low affinity Fe/Cu permease
MSEDQVNRTIWNRDRVITRNQQRSIGSRWLYRIDHYSSQPVVAITVIALLVTSLVIGVALDFPARWVIGFETGTSGVTLVMVFVIQHTQGREQAATQRKLDELLRALPEAQDDLIMLEDASEEKMKKVEVVQRDLTRSHAR